MRNSKSLPNFVYYDYRVKIEGGSIVVEDMMIGDILKRMRNIYGFNASEISSQLGISNSYLSEIENNKKQPSLELLKSYSKIFGIKLSSLILLSEKFTEADKNNKSQEFIKNLMIRLIGSMSNVNEGTGNEENYNKV